MFAFRLFQFSYDSEFAVSRFITLVPTCGYGGALSPKHYSCTRKHQEKLEVPSKMTEKGEILLIFGLHTK